MTNSQSQPQKRLKVCIAMSGGVDSSVAAALLKDQGYDVFGVFLHFWSEADETSGKPFQKNQGRLLDLKDKTNQNRCCSTESEYHARLVAEKLGIPFYTLDFKQIFREAVVGDFLNAELQGKTPNPCVVCNQLVKFGVLLRKALAMGADYLATGHYARVVYNQPRDQKEQGYFSLLKSLDSVKDQAYFLYRLNQSQLTHVLFPLGEYQKSEVYRLAEKYQLPFQRNRQESQDLCFIRSDKGEFLKRQLLEGVKTGPILDLEGKQIGRHKGLIFYTIGQRKHLEISDSKPYYVVKISWQKNVLFVSERAEDLLARELIAGGLHWVKGKPPRFPFSAKAKIRSQNPLTKVEVKNQLGGKVRVTFATPQRAVTPGQSIVFYEGSEVLGGGVIQEGGKS